MRFQYLHLLVFILYFGVFQNNKKVTFHFNFQLILHKL